ncbi:MAG TPA: VTT domain-containing protein, partial [Blastocatellia bacterium]|nr:VTT domain-containing protein [Blastocatellia bacterium]
MVTQHKNRLLYYAFMATLGSVLGCLALYLVARKGGEAFLRKRFKASHIDRGLRLFQQYGLLVVIVPALLPPPAPLGPFLLGAGAMNYPLPKFLATLTVARALRFTLVAYLASLYGQRVFRFFMRHYTVMLWSLIGLAMLAGVGVTIYFLRRRRQQASESVPEDQAA